MKLPLITLIVSLASLTQAQQLPVFEIGSADTSYTHLE